MADDILQFDIHSLFEGEFEERVFVVDDVEEGRYTLFKPYPDGQTTAEGKKYINKELGYTNGCYGVAVMIIDEKKGTVGIEDALPLNGESFSIYLNSENVLKNKEKVSEVLNVFYKAVYGVDLDKEKFSYTNALKKATKSKFIQITPAVSIDTYQILLDNKVIMQHEFLNIPVEFSSGNVEEHEDSFNFIGLFQHLIPESEAVREIVVNEGYYVIPDHMQEIIPVVHNLFNKNNYPTVLCVGASGTGKSTAGEVFARVLGVDLIKFDVPNVTEPTDWFYTRSVTNGVTVAEPTNLLLGLIHGNCVIMLDEVNRIPTNLNNALFALLDHNKTLTLNQPDFEKSVLLTDDEKDVVLNPNGFHIAPNIMFVATANIGYGFSGTYDIDEAFFNRFAITETFSTPTKNTIVEIIHNRHGLDVDTCGKIVTAIQEIEKLIIEENMSADCTIRAMGNCAMLVVNGATIRQALMRTIINPVAVRYSDNVKPIIEYLNTIYPPQNLGL